jgi:energy-coupling factor transporter transmembrane protein EcfT
MKGDFLEREKGLKRLIHVLAILAGICIVIYLVAINEIVALIVFFIVFLFLEVISSFAVRKIFGFIPWVGKRFCADKPKDEKKNKQTETDDGTGVLRL